jgi:hypothetical protein
MASAVRSVALATTLTTGMALMMLGCGGSGPQANGTIVAWSSSTTSATVLPPLPTPRANHCSAAANGRLYVVGGNYKPAGAKDFVALDDVQVADQNKPGNNSDGALGPWRQAGTLPSAVTGCTATSDGVHLFVVGGLFVTDTDRDQVWAAQLQPDGSLSAFSSLGPLPMGHTIVSSQAFVRDDILFVFDSTISVDGTMPEGIVLLHAPLNTTSPTLGTWTIDNGPAGFRGRPQYAATARNVYALGGYLSGDLGNQVVADGFGAPLSSKTGMGASFTVASLPAPRAFGAGAGVDDWVFVLGGKVEIFAGMGEADVYAAKVLGDGTLAPFATIAAMPEGRTNLDAVVLGDFLYVTGGGSTGGGLDNVFSARVRF